MRGFAIALFVSGSLMITWNAAVAQDDALNRVIKLHRLVTVPLSSARVYKLTCRPNMTYCANNNYGWCCPAGKSCDMSNYACGG